MFYSDCVARTHVRPFDWLSVVPACSAHSRKCWVAMQSPLLTHACATLRGSTDVLQPQVCTVPFFLCPITSVLFLPSNHEYLLSVFPSGAGMCDAARAHRRATRRRLEPRQLHPHHRQHRLFGRQASVFGALGFGVWVTCSLV